MQIDFPVTGEGIITAVGFVVAVVYQTGYLRRTLDAISSRLDKVDQELAKQTDILIGQESLRQRMDAMTDRVTRLEDMKFRQNRTTRR